MRLNPVLRREMRVRMRSWRAPAVLVLYVGLLGLISLAMALASMAGADLFGPRVGAELYSFIAAVQAVLLAFAVPGLAAGAVSGERERRTLDLLAVTTLTPMQVAWGKFLASLAHAGLLLVASLPVFAIPFLLGGIDPPQVGRTFAYYIATGAALGASGLFFSTLFRRTVTAVVAAYGFLLLWTLGPLLSAVFAEIATRGHAPAAALAPLLFIPPVGLAGAVGGPFLGSVVESLVRQVTGSPAPGTRLLPWLDLWQAYALFCLALAALALWGTARLLARKG